MMGNSSPLRQRLQSGLGQALPPSVSVPLRSRFGNSREPELAVLPLLVHPGDVVVDIGAHKGVYSYQLARLVGPGGHVIAYEPQPALVGYLVAAAKHGIMSRVELRPYALSDTEGEAVLSIPVESGQAIIGQATLRSVGGDTTEHRVRAAVFDQEYFPGRVAFIKIDVEGFELSLLRGAREVLARDKPALLIEVEDRHAGSATAELARLLIDELGYQASEWSGGALHAVDRARWDSGAGLNESPAGGYVNNFVFRA